MEIDRPRLDTHAESVGFPDHGLCRELAIVFKGNERWHKARPTWRKDICIDSPRSLSHLLAKRWAREAVEVQTAQPRTETVVWRESRLSV